MAHQSEKTALIYDIKLSSVGPAKVTGNLVYEPSNIDLAMKLHYLRVVYFFNSQAAQGITVPMLKESLFRWLDYYFVICGRLRRSDTTGRPFIKCNDCGTRFIEAKSSKTLDEWVEMDDTSAHRLLVSNQVIGPELTFSPLTLIQLTTLKCGGVSVGLSCAHILGDAFSLSEYMNAWSRIMAGVVPTHQPNLAKCQPKIEKLPTPQTVHSGPLSLKEVGPVGDHWITETTTAMATWSFHITSIQLAELQRKTSDKNEPDPIPPFESICAVIWQAIAKVRNGPKTETVTIIRKDTSNGPSSKNGGDIMSNSQVVSAVKADFSIAEANPRNLAALIRDQATDERAQITETLGKENGLVDFIVYGANLTFANWEEASFYEFTIKGTKPNLVNCFVDGIGDEGVVLVLSGPPTDRGKDDHEGWLTTAILPENEMKELKDELKKAWSIA
ncbi:hypothetical protein Ancab_014035 [Ancistrocladus abbreviatus]